MKCHTPPRVICRSVRSFTFFLFVLLLLTCTAAWAQKDTGGITGIVTDQSGATISGAKVTITDVDRGTSSSTTTDSQGEYIVSPLKIGRYTVTIEKTGFRKTVFGPVTVDVQERPR